ncbi:MAG: 50S ribosomal protein L1 [Candidatus Hydrogenedentota bacterium]|nr:MAG: 50S ribosomal protein L1 [Candidatus Hydrogenedentota bacterium]
MKRGKKISAARAKVAEVVSEKGRLSAAEAVALAKETARAGFDETVELALRLGINPTQSDQNVRGTVMLPRGSGKKVRVAVFASGDKIKEAEAAGADVVGGADLVEKVAGGWLEFDVAISTPDMMKNVGRLGKILGPRGLMPNPKSGTVTFDVERAVKEFKAGKVEYRNDKGGNVHVPIGKASFPEEDLVENARAVIDAVLKAKPSSSKGTYLQCVTISTTMGPGIPVDPVILRKELGK